MPFADPIINALKDTHSFLHPDNFSHYLESLTHSLQADVTGHLIQVLSTQADAIMPDHQIIEAQSDHVINAETDMQGTVEDENGLHDVNAVHHDSTVQAMHDDTSAHDAYAVHDDASAMGA